MLDIVELVSVRWCQAPKVAHVKFGEVVSSKGLERNSVAVFAAIVAVVVVGNSAVLGDSHAAEVEVLAQSWVVVVHKVLVDEAPGHALERAIVKLIASSDWVLIEFVTLERFRGARVLGLYLGMFLWGEIIDQFDLASLLT